MKNLATKLWQFFAITFLMFSFQISAQSPELEKTYALSGKAKRGYLGQVEYDQATQIYTLTYVTKSTEKKAKFEVYKFDKDFNFLNLEEDEIEFEKAKTKYKWFKFRGELYTVDGLFVEPNMMGTLVLRHKVITYKYDFWILGYYKSVDVKDKLKPKNEDGNKFFYHKHAEDDVTGDALIVAGIKDKIGKNADPFRQNKDFNFMRYNKDLDIKGSGELKFEHPQTILFARKLEKPVEDSDEQALAGMDLVFAPMGGQGMKKFADPNPRNYTYVRIDEFGKVIHKTSFESPATYWKIDEEVLSGRESFLYGPAAEGKDGYANTLLTTTKFKSLQLMKIVDGKVEYLTSTNLDEIESKVKCPPSQKKTPTYEGKKFDIKGYFIGTNNDFYVAGQNFNSSKDGNRYNDVLCLHFDSKGFLKAQYGLDTKETNAIAKANGAPQYLLEGSKSKAIYWVVNEIDDIRKEIGMDVAQNLKLLIYPRIGKIDVNAGSISDFKDLGKVEKKQVYFLDNRFPYLPVDEGNKLVFFGADKAGKNIWFARVVLD
jgi:hypothetical protein